MRIPFIYAHREIEFENLFGACCANETGCVGAAAIL